MRVILTSLLALLPSLALAANLNGIKGADDRVEVAANQYPWSAVGRLNNGQGGHCSGILVGPRLAVTAAHCLWNKKTRRPMPAASLRFVAGYDRGQYLAFTTVESTVIAPGWQFDTPYSPLLASRDWALLILAEPLGDKVGWVGLGAAPNPADWLVTVGYGQDKAHIPAAHLGCHVAGRLESGVLTHDCDAVHGDSGAPVLVWKNGAPTLAAIHVATFGFGGGKFLGGAVAVDAFGLEARRQGAAGDGKAGTLSQKLDGPAAERITGR
ncbi:MAG: trypsin-like serine protease [Magnetospirillum sp.]|nr:trypsin-like serine protease [Magnetospirillum sp.]